MSDFLSFDFKNTDEVTRFLASDNKLITDIKSHYKVTRFEHAKSVATLCFEVAPLYKLNKNKMLFIGLLHDIYKMYDEELQLSIAKKNKYFIPFLPSFSYHAFAAAEFVKERFTDDEEMYDAISFHATGRKEMTDSIKLLYIADKSEPTREFATEKVRQALFKDLHEAFILQFKEQIDYFSSIKINYTSNLYSYQMFEYYKGEINNVKD